MEALKAKTRLLPSAYRRLRRSTEPVVEFAQEYDRALTAVGTLVIYASTAAAIIWAAWERSPARIKSVGIPAE